MHDISNVEVIDPVILLFQPKIISYRYFEFLNHLHCSDLLQIVKAYIQFVSFSHEALFTISLKQLNISLFRRTFLIYQFFKWMNNRG